MQTFDILREKGYTNPEEVFDKAIDNTMPKIECRPKRVGGAIYQVPTEVPPGRSFALASRWILAAARGKSGKDFSQYFLLKNLSMQLLKLELRSRRSSMSIRWLKQIRHLLVTQIISSPPFKY
jgi:ribosomal protein S7